MLVHAKYIFFNLGGCMQHNRFKLIFTLLTLTLISQGSSSLWAQSCPSPGFGGFQAYVDTVYAANKTTGNHALATAVLKDIQAKTTYHTEAQRWLNVINIDERDPYGASALHLAAANCRNDLIDLLLETNANTNARVLDPKSGFEDGMLPLHLAIRYQCWDTAHKLLPLTKDINSLTTTGNHTPALLILYALEFATEEEKPMPCNEGQQLLQSLLTAGADLSYRSCRQFNMLEELTYYHHAFQDCPNLTEMVFNHTPLRSDDFKRLFRITITQSNLNMFNKLISDRNVDIASFRYAQGMDEDMINTPLHLSIFWFMDFSYNDSVYTFPKAADQIIRSLVNYDKEALNIQGNAGKTPLFLFFERIVEDKVDPKDHSKIYNMLEFMLANGADLDLANDEGVSPRAYFNSINATTTVAQPNLKNRFNQIAHIIQNHSN